MLLGRLRMIDLQLEFRPLVYSYSEQPPSPPHPTPQKSIRTNMIGLSLTLFFEETYTNSTKSWTLKGLIYKYSLPGVPLSPGAINSPRQRCGEENISCPTREYLTLDVRQVFSSQKWFSFSSSPGLGFQHRPLHTSSCLRGWQGGGGGRDTRALTNAVLSASLRASAVSARCFVKTALIVCSIGPCWVLQSK